MRYFSYSRRMSRNQSQLGRSSSDLNFIPNNGAQLPIDQLLTTKLIQPSQASSSFQFNSTTMIATIHQYANQLLPQHARRGQQR